MTLNLAYAGSVESCAEGSGVTLGFRFRRADPMGWTSITQGDEPFVASDAGVVVVLDLRTLTLGDRIATEPGAHTTAYDRQRERLYVFLPGSCRAATFAEEEKRA